MRICAIAMAAAMLAAGCGHRHDKYQSEMPPESGSPRPPAAAQQAPPTDVAAPSRPAPGQVRPLNIKAVMESLKNEMIALSDKYPELGEPLAIRVGQIPVGSDIYGLEYAHNCRRNGQLYEDTGPDACGVRFVIFPLADKDSHESDRLLPPMEKPDMELQKLGVGLISRLHAGSKPSTGFDETMRDVLMRHVRFLQDIERSQH